MEGKLVISNLLAVALIFGAMAWLCLRGKIAFALGAYFACVNWGYNVDIGPIHLYRALFVFTILTAMKNAYDKRQAVGRLFFTPRVRSCALLVLVWVVWIGIKTLQTVREDAGTVYYMFCLTTIIPAMLLLLCIEDLSDIRSFAWGFLVCEVPAACASLFVFRSGAWGEEGIVLGLGGANYITFSWGLVNGIILLIALLLTRRDFLPRLAILAAAGLCTFSLILTTARQSVIGLAATLGYVAFAEGRKRKRIISILAVVAVIAAIGYATLSFNSETADLVTSKWSRTDLDAKIRQEYWTAGWEIFLSNPNTGAGLMYMPVEGDSAHNLYLDVLAMQGLVGFLFFLGYVGIVFSALREKSDLASFDSEARTWKVIFTSIMIFDAVHSFGSGSMLSEPDFFWAPFLVVLIAAMPRTEPVLGNQAAALSFQPRGAV